jgi:vacuolar-type H+-ATPase subunit C/Vma6
MARLDYSNARTGARRARLLGPGGVRELLLRPTLAARIEWLAAAGKLAPGPPPRELAPLPGAERMLREALRADEARLAGEAEGAGPRRLLAAALGLRAAGAIKAVLRGVATGMPAPRIVALAEAAGGLDGEAVRTLSGAASPEEVARSLEAAGSPWGLPLREALAGRDRRGLLPAEVAVDRAGHAGVARAARGRGEDARVLRAWLAERADARNGATLLAALLPPGESAAPGGLHLEGGRRIDAAAFARLARAPMPERRRVVGGALGVDPLLLVDPAAADRWIERVAARRLGRLARASPLSLAVPLAWLEARREEVRRIAVLLRATELGLPGDEVLALVEA